MDNHYVPKFLQSQWKGEDGKLQVFKLSPRGVSTKRLAPAGTGYKKDMLTLTSPTVAGMDQHANETIYLNKIDNAASLIHKKLLTQPSVSLTEREKMDWARFIHSLRLRQPTTIEKLKAYAPELFHVELARDPLEYRAVAQADDPPTLTEFVDRHLPGYIENSGLITYPHILLDDDMAATKLAKLDWGRFNFSDCQSHVLLGDHPCIFSHGIDHPNLIVALPISPDRIFLASRGTEAMAALHKQNSSDLLRMINDHTAMQAEKYIYSTNESSKRFIANRRRLRAS